MAMAAGFTFVSALPPSSSSSALQRTRFLSPTPFTHKNQGGILKLPGKGLPLPRINAVVTKLDPSKVVPQADRVLVRLEQLPEKSAGGVLLPKAAVKFERYLVGEVLSVGAEVTNIESGKKVLFSDINAYEVFVNFQTHVSHPRALASDRHPRALVDLGSDSKHCFCRSGDLLALVE